MLAALIYVLLCLLGPLAWAVGVARLLRRTEQHPRPTPAPGAPDIEYYI